VRLLVLFVCISSLVVALSPRSGLAQEHGIAPQHHPWGCFKPGTWKRVRVVTEMLDEKGLVQHRSIAERKTTLIKVERDGVILKLEVVEEVAGKRFVGEPEIIKQGFHGELVCDTLTTKDSGTGQVVIENRQIPCRIVQMECPRPTDKTVTKIYYSNSLSPYILRRESVTTDLEGQTALAKTTVEVMALQMPCQVLAEIKSTAYVKAVRKHAKGTITTWLITSTDVPGGVVSHSSKEVDANKRLIRRSTLQLTGYGLEPETRTGLFGRSKRSLLRRTPP